MHSIRILLLFLLPIMHNIIPINCKNISTGDTLENETIEDGLIDDLLDISEDILDLSEDILDFTDVELHDGNETDDEADDVPTIPGLPDVDPLMIANMLYKIVDLLEDKLKSAMDASESGVCLQIEPINIFLSKNPYLDFEVLVSKEESHNALHKLQKFRAEVANKIPPS